MCSSDLYRALLERFEASLGHRLSEGERKYRYKTHLLLPWVADLIRLPSVLDVVESVIGPDILCWTCSWFIKEPRSDALTLWHQDATFFGLRPHQHVTAWIALTPSNEENGCMQVLKGSHKLGRINHVLSGDQAGADMERVEEAKKRLKANTGSQPLVVLSEVRINAICIDKESGKIVKNIEVLKKKDPQWVHKTNSYEIGRAHV